MCTLQEKQEVTYADSVEASVLRLEINTEGMMSEYLYDCKHD